MADCKITKIAGSTWEVDWGHPDNIGSKGVMARNPNGHLASARAWHLVPVGYLRSIGFSTPTYRKDSWEIDWATRDGKKVWARNQESKMPSARSWHWIDHSTLDIAGLKWRPKNDRGGKYLRNGYVMLTPTGMTEAEIAVADECQLWTGKKRSAVLQHRLIATMIYGPLPKGIVVRHLNGTRSDNRAENLAIGTTKENCADHETARRMAMWWRNRHDALQVEVRRLRRRLAKLEQALAIRPLLDIGDAQEATDG